MQNIRVASLSSLTPTDLHPSPNLQVRIHAEPKKTWLFRGEIIAGLPQLIDSPISESITCSCSVCRQHVTS